MHRDAFRREDDGLFPDLALGDQIFDPRQLRRGFDFILDCCHGKSARSGEEVHVMLLCLHGTAEEIVGFVFQLVQTVQLGFGEVLFDGLLIIDVLPEIFNFARDNIDC